mmetsp:Transcript_7256/g.15109  ORF Transcript_7256/g.15109 Transcript_7256/m.15109 type:complete len:124 (+) Transcript_7256:3-374(+)
MEEEEEEEYHKLTWEECEMILEQVEACMKVLSFGIPDSVWEQSLMDKKFVIDWDLLRSAYKLDAFEKGTTTTVAAKAKQWRRKSNMQKVANMRSEYSSRRFKGGEQSPKAGGGGGVRFGGAVG